MLNQTTTFHNTGVFIAPPNAVSLERSVRPPERSGCSSRSQDWMWRAWRYTDNTDMRNKTSRIINGAAKARASLLKNVNCPPVTQSTVFSSMVRSMLKRLKNDEKIVGQRTYVKLEKTLATWRYPSRILQRVETSCPSRAGRCRRQRQGKALECGSRHRRGCDPVGLYCRYSGFV
eukprot:7381669-Prymnesium_polylepis.4